MDKIIQWHLPIKTVSEANSSEHWSKKFRRHKQQKKQIWWAFKGERTNCHLPCHVKLTRISPRLLDEGDNLPCALKWIRDEIATQLNGIVAYGQADNDKRITWEYAQEKGKPQSIRIEIFN